ncbi:MAG: creatininase family protein [Ferruginibacter sp.]
MRPFILAETNWNVLKQERFELAILPWGATEAHNYHLPYGTDVIEADELAAASAQIAWDKGAKVVVMPSIPFGVNTGQSDIYLDINLNPSTQFAILCDIVETLNRQGLNKLLIFNCHGGNDFKPMIRELGLKYPSMFICVSFCFNAVDRKLFFDEPGDHADEMETSLLLYLKPGLVLPKEKWGAGKEKKNKIPSFSEGFVWAERKWSQITEDTGVGNPAKATKEKGERYFKAVTEKMGALFYEISKADVNDLYE